MVLAIWILYGFTMPRLLLSGRNVRCFDFLVFGQYLHLGISFLGFLVDRLLNLLSLLLGFFNLPFRFFGGLFLGSQNSFFGWKLLAQLLELGT